MEAVSFQLLTKIEAQCDEPTESSKSSGDAEAGDQSLPFYFEHIQKELSLPLARLQLTTLRESLEMYPNSINKELHIDRFLILHLKSVAARIKGAVIILFLNFTPVLSITHTICSIHFPMPSSPLSTFPPALAFSSTTEEVSSREPNSACPTQPYPRRFLHINAE